MNKPYKGKIEEWGILRSGKHEMIVGFLNGDTDIRTSAVVYWEGALVETRNSVYLLGKKAKTL